MTLWTQTCFSLKWDVILPILQDEKFRVVSSESEDKMISLTSVLNLLSLILTHSSAGFSLCLQVFLFVNHPFAWLSSCGSLDASEYVALCGSAYISLVPLQTVRFHLSPWWGKGNLWCHASPTPSGPVGSFCGPLFPFFSPPTFSFTSFVPLPLSLPLCSIIIHNIDRRLYYFVIIIWKDFMFPAFHLKGWWENSIIFLSQKPVNKRFSLWMSPPWLQRSPSAFYTRVPYAGELRSHQNHSC